MSSRPYVLKKSLGQHFLRDENISRKIVAALDEYPFSKLLEVGPGGGALTKYLLEIPGIEFKAAELDQEKINYLESHFSSIRNKIIHIDFLDMDKPFEGKFTVIGNFPYNISSQILFKMIDWKEDVETMIGMFQKELALRAAAKEGNKVYGVLSVLIQAFFTVDYLFDVNEQCFVPPPKVKSGVIRLRPRNQLPAFRTEKDYFLLVKTAFNQRRKTLRNAVRSLFDENILREEIFNRRAEQLSIDEFASLTHKMR